MSWLEVKAYLDTPPDDWSPYVELFREFGVENTLEEELTLTGSVPDVPTAAERLEGLSKRLKLAGVERVDVAPMEEVDWTELWRSQFKPRRVGKRFLIQPSWEEADILPGDVVIILDPGEAFGTGEHPTTRLCLELIEELDVRGKSVADVGCGSGILSIGLAKLGADVEAFDIDPIAVEVAKENMLRNGASFAIGVTDGMVPDERADLARVPQDETLLPASVDQSIAATEAEYDLVVSNIISLTIIRLAPQLAATIVSGGHWIVSGIIDDNWAAVTEAAAKAGCEVVSVRREDGWVGGLLRKT